MLTCKNFMHHMATTLASTRHFSLGHWHFLLLSNGRNRKALERVKSKLTRAKVVTQCYGCQDGYPASQYSG
jgi:hypothetical protein